MMSRKIDIPTSDGICDSFVAYPDDGNGPYPAVLFYMDAFGPRPYLYEMAETLASFGYYVLMPNIFYRMKRAPVVDLQFPLRAEDMSAAVPQIMPLIHAFTPNEMGMRDAGVLLDFLAKQPQAKPGKVGTTGYCAGGGLAIRAAEHFPERIAAAASFHTGNLATDKPDSPHLMLKQIKAEVYFGHADNDKSMPAEQIKRLDEALVKSGIKFKNEVYAGAIHGFTMKDLPAYGAEALQRHWTELRDLLKRNL